MRRLPQTVTRFSCLAMGASLLAAHLFAAGGTSDLADAIEKGRRSRALELLASSGADAVNAAQSDGMTALLWAAQSNDAELVKALLNAGADPRAANRYGVTPLWLAGTNGNAPMTELLLKAGADPMAAMPHGETALMAAARTGDAASIKLLLQHGADPNVVEQQLGETALMWAAAEDHGDAIRALIAGGANPDAHARDLKLAPMDWMNIGMVSTILPVGGWTPLMYAAREDAKDAAIALAESGADMDQQDPDGSTALHLAILNDHYDLAAILLEHGADPNVADSTGMTSLYGAVDQHTVGGIIGRPARPLLDDRDALDIISLALEHGANPNLTLLKPIIGRHHGGGDFALGKGATPLMRAAKSMDMDALRLLLDGGADASLAMADGTNVILLLAAGRIGPGGAGKLLEAMKLAAEHGADVNAITGRGETALMRVARSGANDVVRFLVERGARLDTPDAKGNTALDLVMQPGPNRREETEALLRQLAAEFPELTSPAKDAAPEAGSTNQAR